MVNARRVETELYFFARLNIHLLFLPAVMLSNELELKTVHEDGPNGSVMIAVDRHPGHEPRLSLWRMLKSGPKWGSSFAKLGK